MNNGALQDSFDFFTVGTGDNDFGGYNSDADVTVVPPNVMVEGTKNVTKINKGTISVRPGLKRFGQADSSLNGIKSSFEWETSFAAERPIRVLVQGQFQVLYNSVWTTLKTFDLTRFVFTTWWQDVSEQELLVMVNGDNNIYSWSGGIVDSVGVYTSAAVMISGAGGTISLVPTVITGSERIATGENGASQVATSTAFAGTDARAAFVLSENPHEGDRITLLISQNTPFQNGNVEITFSATPTAPALTSTTVIIGATKEATATNLLGFFQDPGTTTATHVAITDANTIDAVNDLGYAQVNALKTSDGTDWQDQGFTDGYPNVGSAISVGGTEYTYTLIAEDFLVNISGDPPSNTPGFQIISTNPGPSTTFKNDFVATITNQLIVGSYSSPIVYFSADTNYLDFTNAGDLISGDPDTINLDELPKGVIVVNESAYIPAGSNAWYICTPNTPLPLPQTNGANDRLVIVKVEKKIGAAKTAALAHEFLGSIADTIVYLGQDHQLRMFGIFKDILGTKFPSLSIDVKQEFIDTDFDGGQLRCIGDDIYIVAPVPGVTFFYQQRDDVAEDATILSQRIWQPPQTWNISRIAIINNIVYGYSNQSPETYQLWDTGQWHDDTPTGIAAYQTVLRFGYWQFRDRTKLGNLDKVFIEGYMPQNNNLICTLRSDYLGSTAIEDVVIATQGDNPTLFTEDGVLVGDALIGQQIIGGATGQTGLPKFRVIADFTKFNCFEYQLELSSSVIDSQWEVICIGTNGQQVVNNPVNLRKG